MGDHRASVALLAANAAEHPQSSGAAFALGRAYRETKEFAKARAQFENAIRLDPNNKRAREGLNALASDSGRTKTKNH
jgi:cytochrome c-type biogenesis protein CcmH/NrfG